MIGFSRQAPCRPFRSVAPHQQVRRPPAPAGRHKCTPAAAAQPVITSASPDEQQFLSAINRLGFPSGILPGKSQDREQVEALIPALEASSPTPEPLGPAPGAASPLLFGAWQLVYASNGTVVTRTPLAQALVAASAVPGVGLKDVQQELVSTQGRIETSNSAVFGLGPLGEWDATIYGTWEAESGTLARVAFEAYSVQLVGAFGWRPLSGEFLKLRIPLPEAARERKAEFRTTYVSQQLRIARGSTGVEVASTTGWRARLDWTPPLSEDMTHAAVALAGDAAAALPALLLGGVLPSHLLQALQTDADRIAECPNFWLPREDIEAGKCRTAAEAAIVCLFATCLRGRLPDSWAGAEWWVQVYQGGRGLAFHFDKDEHAMKVARQMVTPIFSSVLYLTGDSGAAQRQSPTVIVNQRFDQGAGCVYPDSPDCSTLVFPAANRYCLFDGGLGHGVLDCGRDDVRATFLVNWWERQPQAVQRVTEKDIAKYKLSPAPLAGDGCCGDGSSSGDEGSAGENDSWRSNGGAAAGEAGGCGGSNPVPIPSIEVSEQEVEAEGCLTLDDLLAARGLALAGKGAMPGVAIAHPGLVLFPVSQEQLRATEGELQVGAVLVPLASLPGDSGDEEEEEEAKHCGTQA